MPDPTTEIRLDGLEGRIVALPGVAAVRAAVAASGAEAYLVGGAVRDCLLGLPRADLDVAVAGDQLALAAALGATVRVHDRFGTAAVETETGWVDIAVARTESYARPGALPDVRPAGIVEDLGRRDFTVNALAVPLFGSFELIDPHGGVEDLRASTLRLLHGRSIADDPTRALRAARYGARFGFAPEPDSLAQIKAADLATVSAERVDAELRLIAGEASARVAFELLDRWGLIPLDAEGGERIDAVIGILARESWTGFAAQADAVLAARAKPTPAIAELVAQRPDAPSAAVVSARGHGPVDLVLARALGAEWLDRYVCDWRHVRLAISGADLLDAGVPQGPAVGVGLAAALRAKLDGEAGSRADELRIALAAAAPD